MKRVCQIFLYLILTGMTAFSQVDKDPPVSPVLTFVSVRLSDSKPILNWTKSPSPDAAGYVVYYYANGAGQAFDTIHDPNVTSYINTGSASQYFVESYVVAALDTAGNISPLSNELHTILPSISPDSCHGIIHLAWNPYNSYPDPVTGYTVMVSENGGTYAEAGETPASKTSFDLSGIKPSVNYCFSIRAILTSSLVSTSSTGCRVVRMQRFPDWINADFATVNDNGNIDLSFTIDPLSGIRTFAVNRMKLPDGSSSVIATAGPGTGNISYTDNTVRATDRYRYWLEAINDCGIVSGSSNPAGNILLETGNEESVVALKWNRYVLWNGGVEKYDIYLNTGTGFNVFGTASPSDSTFNINYKSIMNEVSSGEVCFFVEASEMTDIYGITGKSRSNTVCITPVEKITVPNAFTPDNDNLNDLFKPVLSFTPSEYHLYITDRQNNRIFETTDYLESWDGTKGGSKLPADVYLWYLRVTTPSGKKVIKSGTIAIVRTR